jgi:hypothetical protein
VGTGLLTSLDVASEVAAGELCFTHITDPIITPMTVALCTSASRTTSYAADILLNEIQNGFARLSYRDAALES